jgi:uncharacterized protein (DUF983 family)
MSFLSLPDPIRTSGPVSGSYNDVLIGRHEHAERKANRGSMRQIGARLWAILRQRCPRCWKGRMFRGSFAMNDPCPVCGLIFQREEGYFLGAMYVSYVLACAIITPIYFLVVALFPDWGSLAVAMAALVPCLVLTPGLFRYSRVIWAHVDRIVDPSAINAGPYEKEKLRLDQLAKENAGRPTEEGATRAE